MSSTLSPYHKNIERFVGRYGIISRNSNYIQIGSYFDFLLGIIYRIPVRYYSGQLSISELREFRKHKWQGMDMGNLLDAFLRSFDKRLTSNNASLLVVKEILAAILILSDLFNREQFKW